MKIADNVFVFKRKINNFYMKHFFKFYQNWRNFSQKFRKKVNEINAIHSIFSKVSPRYLPVKNENQKIFLNSRFYSGQAFLWYQSQLSTMNISIGQNWLNKKKPSWVYSSSPLKRTINLCWLFVNNLVDSDMRLEKIDLIISK